MERNIYIIGISGATNSGKTTLTNKLLQTFNGSHSFNQDQYFLYPGDERLEPVPHIGHYNFETLSALDMKKMMEDIEQWLSIQRSDTTNQTPIFLFLDGFLILNYRPFLPLFQKKYFLTVTKETCYKRRIGRNYDPPDVPGYFEDIVWPMYHKNKHELLDQKDNIVYLDGESKQEDIYDKICSDLLKMSPIVSRHCHNNNPDQASIAQEISVKS